MSWQPIETAPHGVSVLLFIPASLTPAYQEVGFASGGKRYPTGASSMWRHGYATHWQPLPEPPAKPPGGRKE